VLLDTNVLIAAFVSRGRCANLLEHCAEAHEIMTSEALLAEYGDKLIYKFRLDPAQAHARVALLRSVMHIVAPGPLPTPVSRDPDDDLVLATGVAGACRCIVTGDKDLLVLGQYAGMNIVTPGEFGKYNPDL
jgi:putative PIN family toxin of toxin-antitoxin system